MTFIPTTLTLTEYQQFALVTAVHPDLRVPVRGLEYAALGLAGEAGEFANKVKKIVRGDCSLAEKRDALIQELGGVLWYAALAADEMEVELGEVGALNLVELKGRQMRGTIKGDGDDR